MTAHIGVQPFTNRGLKLPGAHVVADSREVFGGPLTQITWLATKQTKDKDPNLFKAVANALEESIRLCSADKRAAAELWKKAQNASVLLRGVSQPHRRHEVKGRRLEGTVLGNRL